MKHYKAQYGNVVIDKVYCYSCKDYTFVIDTKTVCCDASVDMPEKVPVVSMVDKIPKRKCKGELLRERLRKAQNNKCFFCGCSLDGKTGEIDHLIPISYLQSEDDKNMVLTCIQCNHKKYNKLIFKKPHTNLPIIKKEKTHRNALKTHCPYGHPYSGENLYTSPKGYRYCRICIKKKALEQKEKNIKRCGRTQL